MIAGFEVGGRGPLLLREEVIASRGAAGGGAPWTLLYASDLHLTAGRTALVAALLGQARAAAPDVVLLGGDLVDDRGGLSPLEDAVAQLAALAPVAAVAGNHDVAVGGGCVRTAVIGAGGRWLHDAPLALTAVGRRPLICRASRDATADVDANASDATAAAAPAEPVAAQALQVWVGHHPAPAAAAARHGFDLALAGHLHGGQCVLWQRGTRLYPGAWFSRWNGLRFALGDTTLLVSRGAADTLPIRFRCPREVLLCRAR